MERILLIILVGDIQRDDDQDYNGEKRFYLLPKIGDANTLNAIRQIKGQYYYKISKSLGKTVIQSQFLNKPYQHASDELILTAIYNNEFKQFQVDVPLILNGEVITEVYEANIALFLNSQIP